MGNYKFRLSEVMPNAWLYKLKDMAKTRKQKKTSQTIKKKPSPTTKPSPTLPNRDKIQNSPINFKASDTHFPDPPRKSKTRGKRRSHRSSKLLLTSSVSAGCSLKHPFDGASWSSSCTFRVTSSANDIIIDLDSSKCSFSTESKGFRSVSELDLPPVLTKPAIKFDDLILDIKMKETDEGTKFGRGTAKLEKRSTHESLCVKVGMEGSIKGPKEEKSHPIRSSTISSASSSLKAASQVAKICTNTPRLSGRTTKQANNQMSRLRRKNLSESYAIIKPSADPQRDFKESMVEMITENNIRASKDLEDLLACYLSLNSNEYHDIIVTVFERIWSDLNKILL